MKTRIIFYVAASVLSVACAKIQQDTKDVTPGKVCFTASVEPQLTKTELNSSHNGLLWVKDDPVIVYGSTGNAVHTSKSSGASTVLEGDDVGEAPFAAFYPASIANAWSASTKEFTVSLSNSQTYVAGNIAGATYPMMGYIESGKDFAFKNIGGLVCVKIKSAYDNIKVQSIKITAATPIAGDATVAWEDGDPKVILTSSDEADKTITLDCSAADTNTGVSINSSSYTLFYIVMPAGKYSGLEVTVTGSIMNKTYIASQTLTSPVEVGKEIEVFRSAKTDFKIKAADIIFDLSQQKGHENETANCYLIKEPGKYKFPVTVKGNGVDTTGTAASKILSADILSSGIYYTDGASPVEGSITVADGYAIFGTPKTITSGGNALFGIFDEADIAGKTALENASTHVKGHCIWSWNIWANTTVSDVNTGSFTFLSCNLGAHVNGLDKENKCDGLFFQWGRKDPFPQAERSYLTYTNSPFVQSNKKGASSITEAIKNPTTVYCSATNKVPTGGNYPEDWCDHSSAKLWDYNIDNMTADSVNKTMYDPCPVGYHVPSAYALNAIVGGKDNISDSCYWLGVNGSQDLCFPAIGFRSAGGGFGLVAREMTTAGTNGSQSYSAYSTSEFPQRAALIFGNTFRGLFGKAFGTPIRPQKDK